MSVVSAFWVGLPDTPLVALVPPAPGELLAHAPITIARTAATAIAPSIRFLIRPLPLTSAV